ncbi:MAG: flagellar biosynthetic protein FliR [Syntrophobacteraceae bacterium]
MGINVDMAEVAIFLSILLRLSIIFFMLPVFGAAGVPSNVKVCTVAALSLMLLPLIRQSVQPLPLEAMQLTTIVVGEIVFGMVFALSMLFVLAAFEFAGELISFEMGFGFSQVADPQTGAQFTILSVWAQLLALMVFFALNGHHIVLKLIIESFKSVPVGSFTLDSALFGKVIMLSGILFVLAIKLAAPVMTVLILAQLGMGLISKFAPQINILATSWPLTIGLGILFLGLTVVVWGEMASKSFAELFHFLGNLSK